MIENDRFRDILQRLLKKSEANQVSWSSGMGYSNGEEYIVAFPEKTRILLYYSSRQEEPDYASATLEISGREAAVIKDEDGGPNWELLSSLVSDAQRCVFGYDKALKAIDDALGTDKVGEPPPRTPEDSGPPPELLSGDDIPF
jgi:hypothetical protein